MIIGARNGISCGVSSFVSRMAQSIKGGAASLMNQPFTDSFAHVWVRLSNDLTELGWV